MDIKALKAQRRVLRTAFTVILKKLQSEIQGDAIDLKNISLLQTHLKDKYLRLETVQESVSGVLLQKDDDGTEHEADFSEAEKYREDYLSFSTLVDKKLEESVIVEEQEISRKFRLPKLELRVHGVQKTTFRFGVNFRKSITIGASRK
ncbi:uncharacterized protein TNIN_136261 [Trichonephila inaurata madagascariensis]|uniref:Uncharacterized protein n=1 Tax=Trichonephila inaurata madagascariensis TaxID=2747483 RepID=A0A8X6XYZ1_9ARAC|nr:uncharacterized protein TNIN_136261 [Trichonephila inaurata madagascariensis]